MGPDDRSNFVVMTSIWEQPVYVLMKCFVRLIYTYYENYTYFDITLQIKPN